jgi:hypothetical protein
MENKTVKLSTELNSFHPISASALASDFGSQFGEVDFSIFFFVNDLFGNFLFFILNFGKLLFFFVFLLLVSKLYLAARKYLWLFVLALLVCSRYQLI